MSRWIVLAFALLAVAACQSAPGADGEYARPARGGWDNFRA
jgi:hypothetical protein